MASLIEAPRSGLLGEEFQRIFPDPAGDTIVQYDAFDLDAVKERIRTDGYAIVRDLVPTERLMKIREVWLERFSNLGAIERVTWAPYLGQANTIGFTDDKFQHLYRSCDFLWNPPYDVNTREVGIRLNGLRNAILGLDPLHGVKFSSDRYGVFITTSYYPPNRGWLGMHADGVTSNMPLVHHILPLTIKGTDYAEGGLVVINRQGQRVDVDAQMTLGSVLFYDGSLQHGVERVVPLPGKTLGRLQMFAIPSTFTNAELNIYTIGNISLKTFFNAKWLRLKNRLFISLGLSQVIR